MTTDHARALTLFFCDAMGSVGGLKSNSIEPRGGTGCERDIEEGVLGRMPAVRETGLVLGARDYMLRDEVTGAWSWVVLSKLYGPRKLSHRPYAQLFDRARFKHVLCRYQELASVLEDTATAIEAGVRLFHRQRRAELEQACKVLGLRMRAEQERGRESSPSSAVEQVLALDSRLPLEPHPERLSRYAFDALIAALGKCGRDVEARRFLMHALEEAAAMRDVAGDAFVRALSKAHDDDRKTRRRREDEVYAGFLRGRTTR